jgi:hypothetical protein
MTIKEAYRHIAQLEDCTLPRNKWTHELHLATGMYLILAFGTRALPEMKERIWRYNDVMGKGNTNTGYHETLTVFWLWAVRQFIMNNNITQFDEPAIHALLNDETLKQRKLIEEYYEEIDLYISRKHFMLPSLKDMAEVKYFLSNDKR